MKGIIIEKKNAASQKEIRCGMADVAVPARVSSVGPGIASPSEVGSPVLVYDKCSSYRQPTSSAIAVTADGAFCPVMNSDAAALTSPIH